MPFSELLGEPDPGVDGWTILILGDTGEGDWSQYSLLPLIRATKPHLMILNGDVAYPAGRSKDFAHGFFAPYRGLGIPVWAVPGNHEYYSRLKGREFFDVFCTYRHSRQWSEAGLPLVPQPGTYWEIREPTGDPNLVILGLDSGMSGDLDGNGLGQEPDDAQLSWLRSRLIRAKAEERPVVVLFHIPALVNEAHDRKVHLRRVHEILAGSSQVRLVITGHIHNHQYYAPRTFSRYLKDGLRIAPPALKETPHYIVSGVGGAFLAQPKREGTYPAELFYPSSQQWQTHVGMADRLVSQAGLGRTLLGRVASGIGAAGRSQAVDADAPRYLGFVMLRVTANGTTARHVLMDDLKELFALPEGQIVQVDDPHPPVDPGRLKNLLERYPEIQL